MKALRPMHRRSVLRGLALGGAVTIALPTLEAMLNTNGTAHADGTPLPKRFGVFFWGNGVRLDRWTPKTTGKGFALPEELAPFENVKKYLSVVSGYDIKAGNERGHHAGCVGILSGAPMISQEPTGADFASTFSAPSIDQIVAEHFKDQTRFRSLEVGVASNVTTGEGSTLRYLSHNGPDSPNPAEYSPGALFDRLFGNGFTPPDQQAPTIDPKLALRRSVLDAVRQDANSLRMRLGKNDQRRIDQHLDSIRALENQIKAIESAPPPPVACALPERPQVEMGNAHLIAINDAMSKLTAMSLACDQSRVFSLHFSGSVGGTSYPEIGIPDNHHSLSHEDGGSQERVHAVTVFIMQRFAALLETFQATLEGEGNLLDNSVILASTDVTEGLPHTIDDYPILVAGGGGGALSSGVHVRGNGQNTSDVLLSLVQAMGMPLTEFGQGKGKTSSVVSELLV